MAKPKPRAPLTPEQRKPYLARLAAGEPAAAVAKAAGVNPTTLYRWAKKDGVDLRARHSASPEKTEAAQQGARLAWAARRDRMADRFGEIAEQALDLAATSLGAGAARNAQSAVIAACAAVDKAQLLTGGATSRTSTVDPSAAVAAGRARVSHLRPVRGA